LSREPDHSTPRGATGQGQAVSAIRSERINTKTKQNAARRYAEARGISYKSALRTIDRYTTTTAAQKRRVRRPNPDIVQSIMDAWDEESAQSEDFYTVEIDPPGEEKIHSYDITYPMQSFDAAKSAANTATDNYRHDGGSDPHLWRATATKTGLLDRDHAFLDDSDTWFLIPQRSEYQLTLTHWVPRR
jgi:hypothetical protein